MNTLDKVLKRENNNFDFIRLLASLMVVYGHSFTMFPNNGYHEPIRSLLKTDYSGSLAVYIFFTLSGCFITDSFLRASSFLHFIRMRLFRIWPALISCVMLTVFIIGPFASTYTLPKYFTTRLTWSHLASNILLYKVKFILPGVFEKNYNPQIVNGSLWTLPIEVSCYFLILIMGISKVLRYKWIAFLCYALIVFIYLFRLNFHMDYLNKPFIFFVAGSILCLFKSYIFIDYRILIILGLFCGSFYNTAFFYVTFIYGIFVIGSFKVVRKVRLPGDYSYGIYIYGYLIQQLVASYFIKIGVYQALFISLPFILSIAILSWHFIEKPSLKLG